MSKAPTLTYLKLVALSPCNDKLLTTAERFGGPKQWRRGVTAAQARTAGIPFDDILWAASAIALKDKDIERRLRLWLCDCAAHVLRNFEKEFPEDMRPREAIIAARKFARGTIDSAAWSAARSAAWSAARSAAWSAARSAAWSAARSAAWSVESAARSAAWSAARSAESAESAWQFDRLVLWLSAKEPADYPLDNS